MSRQVDPSVLEKWFALVSRWQDLDAELQSALAQLDADDPQRDKIASDAELKFAEIKREMDALIASAKPTKDANGTDFIAGSIDTSKIKL